MDGSARVFVRLSVFFFRFLEFLGILESRIKGVFYVHFELIDFFIVESLEKRSKSP
jgi:hypothetical protein